MSTVLPRVLRKQLRRDQVVLFFTRVEPCVIGNIRFVPIKSPEQQSVLALHTARESFVHARSARANQIRGLLIARLLQPSG